MRPGVGAAIVGALGATQMAMSGAVAGLIGAHLEGSFPVEDGSSITVSCALSMTSGSACVGGYITATGSIVLSLLLVSLQCAIAQSRSRLGFLGPIASAVGFVWWLVYAGTTTSAARGAERWDTEHLYSSYRTAVVALSWACSALFMLSFFVSAAAAAAAARARSRLTEGRAAMLHRASPSKRYNQPAASPPSSPCKSVQSFKGSYEPFESESPKKWVQPPNPRTVHCPVTSDGHRTLLLVEGEPVPLSPNLSPMHSPVHSPKRSPVGSPTAGRSPMHRSLTAPGGGAVGSFKNILLPHGSEQL